MYWKDFAADFTNASSGIAFLILARLRVLTASLPAFVLRSMTQGAITNNVQNKS